MIRFACSLPLLATLLPLAGCSSSESEQSEIPPRAVSVAELVQSTPDERLRFPATVVPWKAEQIAFEVSGRVEFAIEAGIEVEGPIPAFSDAAPRHGTLIAKIDGSKYERIVERTKAELEAAERNVDTLRVQVEKLIPKQLAEAKARLDLANAQAERSRRLLKNNAVSRSEYDQNISEQRQAQAAFEQVTATAAVRAGEQRSAEARVRETQESLRQAELDLEHCEIYAPFSGNISRVEIVQGGYVQVGEPVITLLTMDPLLVKVEVSPAVEAKFRERDRFEVFTEGNDEPLNGYVFFKDPVADPQTRTYTLDLIVRNYRVNNYAAPELAALPKIHDYGVVWNISPRLEDGLGVLDHAFHQYGEQDYLWLMEPVDVEQGVYSVRKTQVVKGTQRTVNHNYQAFALQDQGEAKMHDIVAFGVPEGVQDGDRVLHAQEGWRFRSGDVVSVQSASSSTPLGFYVPLRAIAHEQGNSSIVHVSGSAESGYVANRLRVILGKRLGDLIQVLPHEQETLPEGILYVVDGPQYLADGQAVSILARKDVR